MQELFWWWQCSDRYIISLSPHLRHTPFPPFFLLLISLRVSVDIKHHVYFTKALEIKTTHSEPYPRWPWLQAPSTESSLACTWWRWAPSGLRWQWGTFVAAAAGPSSECTPSPPHQSSTSEWPRWRSPWVHCTHAAPPYNIYQPRHFKFFFTNMNLYLLLHAICRYSTVKKNNNIHSKMSMANNDGNIRIGFKW